MRSRGFAFPSVLIRVIRGSIHWLRPEAGPGPFVSFVDN